MIKFSSDYFQKFSFDQQQLAGFLKSARHYLAIAKKAEVPEVIFEFTYNALIKYGIYLIAKNGYKIRSVVGHHIKLLEKISEIRVNEEIAIIGNRMRQSRNFNLYDQGLLISEKDAKGYFDFVSKIINH